MISGKELSLKRKMRMKTLNGETHEKIDGLPDDYEDLKVCMTLSKASIKYREKYGGEGKSVSERSSNHTNNFVREFRFNTYPISSNKSRVSNKCCLLIGASPLTFKPQ